MLRNKRLKLKSCIKHYTLDQDKVVTPSETVKNTMARLEKMFELSHLRLEPRQSEIEGAYSYSSLSDQLNANGKGLTLEQSRASAIMEFAERYSWHYFDYKSCDGYVVKSFDQIKKGKIPTVEESYFLNHFAEIENRAEILSEIKNIPLKWVKGVSLMDYKEFYYPISWHNYAYTSNGLATGNALEEAVLQALCEVIERENVYRFFGECKEGNDLDQDSIGHPIICKALENAKKQGFEFIIKDISLDFKVPTFVVQGTREADKKYMHYQGCGFGTHPNPAKALIRALSEYFEGYFEELWPIQQP